MKKMFLVLGITCASLLTYGQSSAENQKKNPRDSATGQASGKSSVTTARETGSGMATGKTAQPATGPSQDAVIHRDLATREAANEQVTGQTELRESPSKTSLGKTSAVDDWNAQNKNSMSGAQSNPMYKDNGMSGTNPLYQGSQKITKSRSNIQNNRVATGDVTGDGSAGRAVKTRSNIQNNRVAAGDVDGDGVAEGVVKSKSNITNNRESDASAGKGASDKKLAPRDAATGQASGKRQHN